MAVARSSSGGVVSRTQAEAAPRRRQAKERRLTRSLEFIAQEYPLQAADTPD